MHLPLVPVRLVNPERDLDNIHWSAQANIRDFIVSDPLVADPFIKQGKIRALAVTAPVPLASMHGLPTIAIALKGCVEIPQPLPRVMKDLNKHYAAMQIEGFVGAWRRTNGKVHIAYAAHDETLLDHLNRHISQALMGGYE